MPAGSYTVTEGADPANFAFESLTCTTDPPVGGGSFSISGKTATITVVPNGTVTCIYTNKLQLGASTRRTGRVTTHTPG